MYLHLKFINYIFLIYRSFFVVNSEMFQLCKDEKTSFQIVAESTNSIQLFSVYMATANLYFISGPFLISSKIVSVFSPSFLFKMIVADFKSNINVTWSPFLSANDDVQWYYSMKIIHIRTLYLYFFLHLNDAYLTPCINLMAHWTP